MCSAAAQRPPPGVSGTKYQPSTADGVDFNTGDHLNGWKCLAFSMTQASYYAYFYAQGAGSGLSGATANGFEASALGDLDGDGASAAVPGPHVSFFARGADVRNGTVVVSTELFIQNEYESRRRRRPPGFLGGGDGTRTRGLRRDRPAL